VGVHLLRAAAAFGVAVCFLAFAAPALADDGSVTIVRLCYVADADTPVTGLHSVVLPAGHAICATPSEQARPSIDAAALTERFPAARANRPELPVAIVQCGAEGATTATQSTDSLSLSTADLTRRDDLSAVVASCAGDLVASVGRDDTAVTGLVGSGGTHGLGPWTPDDSGGCGGGSSTDPRLADGDGGTGGTLHVWVEEKDIEVVSGGSLTVEVDEDGIEIIGNENLTVEVGDVEIVSTGSDDDDERPAPDDGATPCQEFETFIWECGQSGWKRSDCQAMDLLLRCGVDVTIVNPTDEGFACPKGSTDASAIGDASLAVLLHACGSVVAHPVQGENPCGGTGATVLADTGGGTMFGCNGTIAETDGMGCPIVGPTPTGEGGGLPGPTGPGPELGEQLP
jgi:hypothetical protein